MASLIRFCTFVLVCSLVVQQIQVKRIENQQIAAWHQFKLEYETRKSDAALPAAFALAAPHVLAALVVGTGFFWCYKHGGKEAWYQFTGAVIDGVNVTKQWLQEKIAENNGIDTTGTEPPYGFFLNSGLKINDPNFDITPFLNTPYDFWHGNKLYSFSITGTSAERRKMSGPISTNTNIFLPEVWRISGYHIGPESNRNLFYKATLNSRIVDSPVSPWPGFDPSDYPELYTGPALLSNCHQVSQQYPDLSLLYAPLDSAPPEANSQNTIVQPISAATADGGVIDDKGWLLPPPPVMPDLPLPELDSGVGWIDVDMSEVFPDGYPSGEYNKLAFPDWAAQGIRDVIGAEGKVQGLTNVGGNTKAPALQWVGADGKTYVTPIDEALADAIAQSIPEIKASASSSVTIDPTKPEEVPNDDPSFDLPTIPDFDTEIDWGEMEEWPWDEWLGMLPFLDVLQGSQLQASGSPIISTNLTLLGKSKVISFDFSEYEWLWNAMGLIIYACAVWYSLQLALLKRD